MIQPNELRIENWVKIVYDDFYHKIKSIADFCVKVECDTFYSIISPTEVQSIPLTEELIKKQGWEKVCYYYTDKNGLEIYETNDGWHLHIDDDKCQTTIAILVNSVHELQNAYFVATKKELEIKL